MPQKPVARKRANPGANNKTPPDKAKPARGEKKEGDVKPEWPVASGSQLTREHIPQKLMDELERPWRARVRALTRVLLNVSDRRNDLVVGADRLSKEANKDSQTTNQEMQDPVVVDALRHGGVNVRAPQQETPQGGGGGE